MVYSYLTPSSTLSKAPQTECNGCLKLDIMKVLFSRTLTEFFLNPS